MPLVVQKYGGSSLATPEKIKSLAKRIIERYDSGTKLVIVVSAVGQTTDNLEKKAFELSPNPDARELDMLISVGERESISLMTIAINSIRPGLAISFTGSQIGLITDTNHRNARILEIKGDRLVEALEKCKIPVIAGFQGVSTEKQITTLGRGGSDTTAVAVTAALNADICEIYSDVTGVYSADPRLCESAVLNKELDYETMLTISSLGAKVLKDAAVEYAHRLNIKISTGLNSSGELGTIISNSAALDRNKFVSLVYNDKLSYKILYKEDSIFDNLSKIRYFQKSGSGGMVIFNQLYSNSDSEKCCSLSIVSSGIRSEGDKLLLMRNILFDNNEILAFDISDLKFEIFVKNQIDKAIIQKIHGIFFG
ncbi:MAG: aspartate kinase [Candidatus Delongbacteria bacterium]|nr:aspartate kinase [Candidatus Delongbacteria bacterium]